MGWNCPASILRRRSALFLRWRQAPPAATPASDVSTETGVIDGATFRIDVPKKWNKGVVVMNHGYSPEPRLPAAGAPSARLRVFLDRGFAVAQSSYSKGGWAIEQAMTDNVKMISYFSKKHGEPATVIATGGAMGASVTTASVEIQPETYDAGLVTCCSGLDARLENMNWNFEMLALFDYYFPGVMPPVVGPLNGYALFDRRILADAAKKIQAALDANPEKAEIFRRAWGRKKEDVAGRWRSTPTLIHEAQERSGGNPFSNQTTMYIRRRRHRGGECGREAICRRAGKERVSEEMVHGDGQAHEAAIHPVADL